MPTDRADFYRIDQRLRSVTASDGLSTFKAIAKSHAGRRKIIAKGGNREPTGDTTDERAGPDKAGNRSNFSTRRAKVKAANFHAKRIGPS